MNKETLVNEMAQVAGMTKKNAKLALETFVQCVQDSLSKGDEVKLTGFGVYSVSERAERQGRNVKTGEAITIPQTKYPKFRASKNLKDAINK